ncbi:MAG: HAMP domain-containing histidine kinase [Lachnospiraceae bacterium]|nr:HAMP domain-containing histidine kinase [Lachnospiraceae bacterium]
MRKTKRKSFLQVFISKFLISLPIIALVFIITFAYINYRSESYVKDTNRDNADMRIKNIEDILKENSFESKKEKIKYQLSLYHALTTSIYPGSDAIAYVEDSEGNIILDGSKGLFLIVVPKKEHRVPEDTQFYYCDLEYLESHPELSDILKFESDYYSDSVLEFLIPRTIIDCYPEVLDAYVDPETNDLYLGKILLPYVKTRLVLGYESYEDERYNTDFDGFFKIEYIDLTPEYETGYLKYTNDKDNQVKYFDGDEVSGFTILAGGSDSIKEVKSKTSAFDHMSRMTRTVTDVNGDTYTFHFLYNDKFFKAFGSVLLILALIYLFIDILLCLILSKISYEKLKGFYRNEDYRKALMSSMAHDLKTPLTVMSGYAQNLKENVQVDKREHYVDAILENTDYMNGIIVDILALSKLEESGASASDEKTDFCEIANELKEKYAPMFSEKNITVTVEGSFVRKVGKATVMRVMDNLLTNAYKYTKENGSVKIIGKDKPFSSHSFTIENSPAESVNVKPQKLWEPFVKGDESRSENNGTGLGLSIVKNILDNQRFKSKINYKNGTFKVIIK